MYVKQPTTSEILADNSDAFAVMISSLMENVFKKKYSKP